MRIILLLSLLFSYRAFANDADKIARSFSFMNQCKSEVLASDPNRDMGPQTIYDANPDLLSYRYNFFYCLKGKAQNDVVSNDGKDLYQADALSAGNQCWEQSALAKRIALQKDNGVDKETLTKRISATMSGKNVDSQLDAVSVLAMIDDIYARSTSVNTAGDYYYDSCMSDVKQQYLAQ